MHQRQLHNHLLIHKYTTLSNNYLTNHQQFGFQLLAVNELEHIRQTGKHSPESSGRMYFDGYHYQGILQVTDAVKFQDALRHGIGAGKAYGFGMLLLS